MIECRMFKLQMLEMSFFRKMLILDDQSNCYCVNRIIQESTTKKLRDQRIKEFVLESRMIQNMT